MADWAAGYVTEVNYTQGYYRELSPLAMQFALTCAGFKAPALDKFSYCELGFGQGLSLNFHAAVHGEAGHFFGADINPAHVAIARETATLSQATLDVCDQSFAELLARNDLPQFDYIGFHGVWSWISADNQANMVEFLRRHLKVGGVVYTSYNCLPGWANGMPLRQLMVDYARHAASPAGNAIARAKEAVEFAQKMAGLDLGFFQNAPALKDKLDGIAKQNGNYLVHEYFNQDWTPMYFSEVAEHMAQAKLDYAASSHLIDQIDTYRLPQKGSAMLAEIKHPVMRETVRDFLLNQQFRRDLFVRGARRLSAPEQRRALEATRFVLMKRPETLLDPAGEAARRGIPEKLRQALVQGLAADGGQAKSLGELLATPDCQGFAWPVIRQAMMVMTSFQDISLALPAAVSEQAAAACRRLNEALCGRAAEGNESSYLCSPVTGGGVTVGALQQLVLQARAELGQAADTKALTTAAWARLSQLGQRVVTGGKTCETPEDNLAALQRITDDFVERDLPVLQGLGIGI